MKIFFQRLLLSLPCLLVSWQVTSQINVSRFPSSTVGDAYIASGTLGDTNFGSANNLHIFNDTASSISSAILAHFDLSDVPPNAIILSASLRFERISGTPQEILGFRILDDWDESTVTWNTMPDFSGSDYFIETPTPDNIFGTNYHFYYELKDFVQLWVMYPFFNKGLVMALSSSDHLFMKYKSKEHSYSGLPLPHPLLYFTYILPIEIEADDIVHCSALSATDGSISVNITEGSGNYTNYKWTNSAGATVGTSQNLTGVGYGWYGLEVTDDEGVKGYKSFLLGVDCEKVAITYKPDSNYVDNALIINIMPDIGFPKGPNLGALIIYVPPSINYIYKSVLKFNLIIDHNLTINKAILNLIADGHYIHPNESNATRLRLIEEVWNYGTISYNNYPAVSTTNYGEIPNTVNDDDDAAVDVRNQFSYWKTHPNYGWSMQLVNSGTAIAQVYHSTYADNSGDWPYVEFEVSIPCRYPELLNELHGGYYHFEGTELFLSYNKDYLSESGQLNYAVYDEGRIKQTSLPAASVEYGDNRIRIDMSSLTNGIYVLEVVNQKNRKYYFRFKKGN